MAPTTQLPHDLPTGSLIGGAWLPAASTFEVHDPATGNILAEVADADSATALAALDAAADAAPAWRAASPRARADVLHDVHRTLLARGEEIAALITAEGGKPLAESRAELTYGADYVRWYAEQAVRTGGLARTAPAGGVRQIVSRRPVGPSLLVTPWNFPLAMGTRKIAPALAAGCTVVIKPAALTPLTMLYLMQTFKDAGLPNGVVNCIVTSSSGAVSAPIFADPRLRKLTFTGSTEVGVRLLESAAKSVLRTSMELGGNAPFVVLADADIDAAVAGAMVAKYRNNGEACTAANRFFVHTDVYDEFRDKLVAATEAIVVGPGLNEGTTLGPLIDADAVAKVSSLVDDAVATGGKVYTGGAAVEGAGYFFAPTVIADVTPEARVLNEEIFGPVAPLIRVDSDEEAIALANQTEFGLMAYVYSRDSARGITAVEQLESGMVGLNTGLVSNPAAPFGGVKMSGLGREGSHEGLDEYLEIKYVGIAT